MLIVGDLSGIQDFLFDIRETGGKQAATLRFRSLRLQLICECMARRVLWTLNLSEPDRLLYCAAGKFAIDATGVTSINSLLDPLRIDLEKWLLEHTHGRLKAAIICDGASGTAAERNDAANAKLQYAKLRPWARRSWADAPLVVPAIFDSRDGNEENERDKKLGGRLLDGTIRSIKLSRQPTQGSQAYVGVSVQFSDQPSASPGASHASIPMDRIARHTPRDDGRRLVEFVDLAGRSRGAPMLGVLKADADALGAAIRRRLGKSLTFDPLKQFSRKLDQFFGQALQQEMTAPGSRWSDLYTVFAGGDDLMLVGPWNIVIDFAAHIRAAFMREFQSDGLTISAGCAIVKPKFPIHLAAGQAEAMLKDAKKGTKDQFALLGDVWKWDDHAAIIDAGKQLADWTDAGDIQRGWLHTLLELALLQRSVVASRDNGIIPAMAASRLAYHVARNWPKTGPARQWIDKLMKHFDQYPNPKDPIISYLPVTLRYAMLASRSQGDSQ